MTYVWILLIIFMTIHTSETMWTRWFDTDNPTRGAGDGELFVNIEQWLPQYICTNPIRIEVQTVNGTLARDTNEILNMSDPNVGFQCYNDQQTDGMCEDYRVRLCCPGGKGAQWCLTDEELERYPVVENYSTHIPENIELGETVWEISNIAMVDPSKNYTSSIDIVAGNEANRFAVSEDNKYVNLAGFLDATIRSNYSLLIHCKTWDGDVLPVQLIIHITAVNEWPLYYNETCEINSKGSTNVNTSFVSGALRGQTKTHFYESGIIYANTNNSVCDFEVYLPISKNLTLYNNIRPSDVTSLSILEDGTAKESIILNISKNTDVASLEQQVAIEWERFLNENVGFFYLAILKLNGVSTKHNPLKLQAEVDYENTGKTFPIFGEMDFEGCAKGKFGPMCQHDCMCKNEAECHTWNGACKCRHGWQGPACDIPIEPFVVLTPRHRTTLAIKDKLELICTFNLKRSEVMWLHNGTALVEKSPMLIFPADERVIRLLKKEISKQDSGVYQCSFFAVGGVTLMSNEVNIMIEGCKDNAWGEKCENSCDCKYSLECSQNTGCVCQEGWVGQHCQLDIQAPQVHNCPIDITQDSDYGKKTAVVVWDPVDVTDNAESPFEDSNYEPGDVFEIGTTTVVYNISDGVNTVECTFSVNIVATGKESFWWTIAIPLVAVGAVGIAGIILILVFKQRCQHRILYDELQMFHLAVPDEIQRIPCADLAVLQYIGEGEFSIVRFGQLTEEPGQLRDVAVKIIRDNSSECLFAFQEEVTRLEYLSGHPNVIQLIGVVMQKDTNYIVTELMSNDLLNHLRDLGRKEVNMNIDKQLVKIALDVARAMEYMEHMKVVHRDIAARNILISLNGTAKVGDFGLARDVYQTGEYRRHKGRQGRFPTKWMAPESLTEDVYTYKSDVWSFGVLLWEIATLGGPPHYPTAIPCESMVLADRLIQHGDRLAKPERCSTEFYALMTKCWLIYPRERHSVDIIIKELNMCFHADKGFFNA